MIWGISDPALESVLLGQAQSAGIEVRRRCVDAVELLAASAVSPNAPVLVHMDLPRLSREVLAAITAHTPDLTIIAAKEHQFQLAQSWGFGKTVLIPDSQFIRESQFIRDSQQGIAVEELMNVIKQPSIGRVTTRVNAEEQNENKTARVVCLWSATGSTGRSTLAVGMAEAWAQEGERVLLIDADTCAPSLATALGVTEDFSGIVVACRYADQNSLDRRSFSSACRELKRNLWILTGLSDPQRWPEVGPASLRAVIDRARDLFDRVIIDIAPISHISHTSNFSDMIDPLKNQFTDPTARLRPERNAASLAVLSAVDTVVVVIRPDAIGALRLIQDFGASQQFFSDAKTVFLVNRVRPRQRISLQREFSGICADLVGGESANNHRGKDGVPMLAMIPEDSVAEAMIHLSATMSEVKTKSKIFRALRQTTRQITINEALTINGGVSRSRRWKHNNKVTDLRPIIKRLGIFGRHSNAAASSNG